MPIPVQAKKFASAKAKAAAVNSSKIQVGPTEEELKKKYNKINEEAEEKVNSGSNDEDDDDIQEEVVSEDNAENETTEENDNENEEESNEENISDEEETTEEDSGENNELNDETSDDEQEESNNEEQPAEEAPQEEQNPINTEDDFFKQIAQERADLRGEVKESDVNIATIPDKAKEVVPATKEEMTFEKLIRFNKNNPLQELKNDIKFDLDSIEIENSENNLHIMQAAELAFNEDSVFQVALLKSGYIAHMKSITFRDRDAIRGSLAGNTDNRKIANIRRKIYKIVYDKIAWTNISGNQKFSFDDFLKITAYDDLETLYFGIFCKSNPSDSDYTITCPYCNAKNRRTVSAQSLANFSSPELRAKLDEMIKSPKSLTPMEIFNKSMVSMKQRILLPNSKIIAEIKVPSLGDYLKFSINYANSNLVNDDLTETIGFLIFLDAILIPDFKKIKQTGKPVYYKTTEFQQMLSYISRLDLGDGETLVDAINEREAKYKVGYRIKSTPCTNCGKELGDTPVSMEDFLL